VYGSFLRSKDVCRIIHSTDLRITGDGTRDPGSPQLQITRTGHEYD